MEGDSDLRKITVTITSQGEGSIEVNGEGNSKEPVAFPDYMTGSEALTRAKRLQGFTVDYGLSVIDHSRVN